MATTTGLPKPHLHARLFGARCVSSITDDALFEASGVRIAFTGRAGGVSRGVYSELNLGNHVGDNADDVSENRRLLLEALEVPHVPLIVPNQVHGTSLVSVSSGSDDAIRKACELAQKGVDAVLVEASQVAALLCFADCMPVILVSPTGRFAVVHAGWRGAVEGVVGKAAKQLARCDAASLGVDVQVAASEINAYIGPHIRVECFETGEEVQARFVDRFGAEVAPDLHHVSLTRAATCDLLQVGVLPDRIADVGICTVCSSDDYFSYRGSGGTCGRHGAFAVRSERLF